MKRKSMKVLKVLTAGAIITSLFSTTVSFTKAETSSADEIVKSMTLREKIGQIIMPDFRQWIVDGKTADMTVLNDEIREIIRDYDFGGIILFANNVKKTEQTTRLTNDLQQTAIEDNNLPLLITIDQEGGNVTRLGTGTSMPGNMALGATRDESAAYDAGDIIGSELHSLGINVNFAPVVDVNSNPNNPVIGERSIGSDPTLVAKIAIPLLKGMQDNNIATAVKHFPGHGDTATDSHVGLPLVNKTYDELKNFELVPFQAAADAGTDMIMTAHIQVPKIETETAISKKTGQEINIPATLSKALITGVIRDKMHYDGVVVTDAMNMSAISENFGEVDAVLRAIKADVDICLMPTIIRSPNDVSKLEAIYQAVENAVNNGEITMENIDNSVKRVVDLKIKRGIIDVDNYKTPIDQLLENAMKVVGSSDHHARERVISQKAITVVKNENNLLPLKPQAGEKILLIGAYSNEMPALQYGITKLMKEGVVNDNVQYQTINYNGMKDLTAIQDKLDWADRIISITEITSAAAMKATAWQTIMPLKISEYAKNAGKEIALISIGKPYDAVAFPDAPAMVTAYASKGMDVTEAGQEPSATYGPNIPAAIDILFGAASANGTLPVDVYALNEDRTYSDTIALPFGYGLHNLTTIEHSKAMSTITGTKTVGETVKTSITLDGVNTFINEGMTLNMDFDKTNFELVGIETTSAKQGNITTNDASIALQLSEVKDSAVVIHITLKVKNTGEFTPIKVTGFTDHDTRLLSFETVDNAVIAIGNIEKPTVPEEKPADTDKPNVEDTKKDSDKASTNTGDSTNIAFASLVGLASVAVLVMVKRARK